jgi:hypothetical protein
VVAVDGENAPRIDMNIRQPDGRGVVLEFAFENFRFGTEADGFEHVPGVGHAHIFVNNQYVDDLRAEEQILELPATGLFEIFVNLGALDHRSMVLGGALVGARTVVVLAPDAPIGDVRQVFDVPIVLGDDPPTFRVRRGETVELRLTSADEQVVHLHGVDIETAVSPAMPVRLLFHARNPGRFYAEAHDANETVVFFLEVLP